MLDPTLYTSDVYVRFIVKVNKTETCWLWTASSAAGYGRFHPHRGINGLAHRWSYEYHVGEIPEGLQIDHLCRVRSCVNPDHLEPVTPRVNTLRGISVPAINAVRDECVNGHPFTLDNTYFKTTNRGTNERHCRECARRVNREWYQRWKAAGGTRSKGKRSKPNA